MFRVNQDYLKLPGSYLFSTVARKQREYQAAHPEAEIIKLSIGDVTQPLAPAIVEALHGAVDEMAHAETFHGYAPDLGYEFLRSAMAKNDYQAKGCAIKADEIFISDGAKEDCGNIQEIFGTDMLNDPDMQPTLEQIVGIQEEKPFECVGSRDEINTAIVMTIDNLGKSGKELPYLLKYYKTTGLYEAYKAKGDQFSSYFDKQNLVPTPWEKLVEKNCKDEA